MFEWSNVEIIATKNNERIKDVTCAFCGHKESVKSLLKADNKIKVTLDRIQKTAEHLKKSNELWKNIKNKNLNLWEALYKFNLFDKKYTKDEEFKTAGTSSFSGRAMSTCVKCNQPIACDINAHSKIASEMPSNIPTNIWMNLKPPSHDIIARLIKDDLGGTTDSILKNIDFSKHENLKTFVGKIEKELRNLDAPKEFTHDFEDFLRNFMEWVDKRKKETWATYFGALVKLARYAVEYGGIPVEETEDLHPLEELELENKRKKQLGI